MNLESAPYIPKESFEQNKKWFNIDDIFSYDNFMNPKHSEAVDKAMGQIKNGKRLGKYHFTYPKVARQPPKMTINNNWMGFPPNFRPFPKRDENKCFDYTGGVK